MTKNFLLAAFIAALSSLLLPISLEAQALRQTKGDFRDVFRQLDPEELPTPNDYRSANGAPGHRYWQQKVDYKIDVSLDEATKTLFGTARIKYRNNSPDSMPYLWLMLDLNQNRKSSLAELTRTSAETGRISFDEVRRIQRMNSWDGAYKIKSVKTASGASLKFSEIDSLLRVDLPQALATNQEIEFLIEWQVALPEQKLVGGRAGYECFTKAGEDGNCIFEAAQWFPRLAAYSDFEGWHNKAFLGAGEFTLEFGDYDVNITVPSDFIISSTGELTNSDSILSSVQNQRLQTAKKNYNKPSFIVTPQEAIAAQKSRASGTKTWRFSAKNVRDFAWAGSRKFIWDAMAVAQNGAGDVMAMSFYPIEAEPLWSTYSTQSIAHTIRVYGRMSFPYPYPTAQSVNGPVGGMEYPMITFNGPRPEKDKNGNITYSDRTKYGLISVVIHEIGHIWFPMVVNSDERQWTWMDEGLNTFLQYVAEQEWSNNYPSRRGDPRDITEYMLSENQVPIMTQSDSILQFGNNAYGKPATALAILRETIIGRENFDRAFKEYSNNWRFKRPTPADFFRSLEESSGVDLDWFWRGWFYSTEHVDIGITSVIESTIDTQNARTEAERRIAARNAQPIELGAQRVANIPKVVDKNPELKDYYDRTDPLAATKADIKKGEDGVASLTAEERTILNSNTKYYNIGLENFGGVVMPVILKFSLEDNTTQTVHIPAEIWRRSPKKVNWLYSSEKVVTKVELDPNYETADANRNNNHFPQKIEPTRIQAYKLKDTGRNQMKDDDITVTPDSIETKPARTAPK